MHIFSKPTQLILVLVVMSASAIAQEPTVTITPDHAPAGFSRIIEITAHSSAAITVMRPTCLWLSVDTGGPNGTPVLSSPMCFPSPTTVPPCGSLSQSWNPPSLLGPGTYWMRCDATDAQTGAIITKFVDFRIDGPAVPTLSASASPTTGLPWMIDLAHPGDPAAGYFAAASLTTDTGIPIGGDPISLDPDILFQLALPTHNPGIYVNFMGGLDLSGSAVMALLIPDVPFLDCMGIHVQAVLFSSQNPIVLSNCLDAVIQ